MACRGSRKALPLALTQPHGLAHRLRGGSVAPFRQQPTFAAAALLFQLLAPTRDPHQGGLVAQVMEDRPADVLAGKGLKGLASAWDKQFGSAQQPEQAHLGEVIGRFPADTGVVAGNWCH